MRGRAISTRAAASGVSRSVSSHERVIVNFWSPGYKTVQSQHHEGKKTMVKVFHPTSTVEAAMAYFGKKYGADAVAKYKHDIHPGHISIETVSSLAEGRPAAAGYLSFGTVESLDRISHNTHHTLSYTDSFREDVLAFERFPEGRIDFYTLDQPALQQAIQKFKETEQFYSILGKRFGFAAGESCATGCYVVLQLGGMDKLLLPHQQYLSRKIVLTPSLCNDYVTAAKKQEGRLSKNTIKLSEDFKVESSDLSREFQKQIDELRLKRLEYRERLGGERKDDDEKPSPGFKLK